MQKDFLTLEDYQPADMQNLVDDAIAMKADRHGQKPLAGKNIAMIFTKSSTRTRIAFEVGINQLGGNAIFLSPSDIQLGRGESITDTSKVISRYLDGLVVRTYSQQELEELANSSSIPVINALTDKYHPCQAVGDYAVLKEKKGDLGKLSIAYIGDGNNVAHSLIVGGAMLGVDVRVAAPKGYEPDINVIKKAEEFAKDSGAKLTITNDPAEAVKDADAIYTDVWVSMGQEKEAESREKAFHGFMVDDDMLKLAKTDCIVMHCLPAYRGKEISASVIDGKRSVVWDQAEYKLHAQKAVLKMILGDK